MLSATDHPANAAGSAVGPEIGGLLVPSAARRILVIRLGALGDVVRTRFAFAGLRRLYPQAQIDWLVEDRAADGLAGIVGLHRAIALRRRELRLTEPGRLARALRDVIAELRGRRYDLVVDFHGIFKSGLLAWASGAPLRVGFDAGHARELAWRFLTHRVGVGQAHVSRFERNAALVRFLGGEVPREAPALDLPPAEAGPLPAGQFVVVHPGTSASTRYKRWEPPRFAQVCEALARQTGLRSLVTWGPVPGEREAAEEVVARAAPAAVLAPQTRSVGHLLQLMRGARLFVGSDSGPMHLASLAGLAVVAVFGPTDPLENAPFPGLPHRILLVDVGCNPCREGCPARSCMAAVEAEHVVKAVLELL
jgi:ADP-heptose:LPS heptosyltransferase